jgi:hypothetical protein
VDRRFSKQLKEATVQDIQLELIRRSQFNAFDGEKVVKSLLKNRALWESVILDRLGVLGFGRLPAAALIKLRDLSDNVWNADTLYVLTPDSRSAKELAQLIKKEDWGGEVSAYTDPTDVDNALGSGRETRAIVKVWWD